MATKQDDDLDQLTESLRAVAEDLELLVAKVRAGGDPTGAEKALCDVQAVVKDARRVL